ncbi:MAG: M1 family metallopeptidase [Bacteroidia bacterium]|nr:M1 family metallopeptidase [Bacteroidia bacterium]
MRCFIFLFTVLFFAGCSTNKKIGSSANSVFLDTVQVIEDRVEKIYKPSEKRVVDLIHTKLDLTFDWSNRYVNGKAELQFVPYFYPINEFSLDAKGMNIHSVELMLSDSNQKLSYDYDSLMIKVFLDKQYSRNDTFDLFIEYTAKTYELEVEGSEAITEDRGLYFVNHDGKEEDKPMQIWTQGETEANSCWFPTIDAPNEKMTQEIYLTVDEKYKTLSNGLLIYSIINGDGTRTDYWKQTLPHSPYLAMIAIGDYTVVKEEWNDIEVSYYVEKEYEKYVDMIFGNTPEMLEFYSNILGVNYPWEKYSQVVVRDFVSGAMENTSATVIIEKIQQTEREYMDGDFEDYIAHELFHQWFGDLVTCESWANLALNESFATYGEYLWYEYKFGLDVAQYKLEDFLYGYLSEARFKKVNLIRYYYDDREDMFDAHSYDKGGRILHMLRNYLEDEAFFEAIKSYLTKHRFQTAEVHDLRIAFEEVSGEDLNWFFDQWFLSAGHPELEVDIKYNEQAQQININVVQLQDLTKAPLFKLPLDVDLYYKDTVMRHSIKIEEKNSEFNLPAYSEPLLVNFDAEKVLLGTKDIFKPIEQWVYQYYNTTYYLDKSEALEYIVDEGTYGVSQSILIKALNDKFWGLRIFAVDEIDISQDSSEVIKNMLVKLAKSDKNSEVRSVAIERLEEYEDTDLIGIFESTIEKDSSYMVIASALQSLTKLSPEKGKAQADILVKKEDNDELNRKIAKIYLKHGDESNNAYLLDIIRDKNTRSRYLIIADYGDFLSKMNDEVIAGSLEVLQDIGTNNKNWLNRYAATQSLTKVLTKYREDEVVANGMLNNKVEEISANKEATDKLKNARENISKIEEIVESIKSNEKDETLVKIYENNVDISDMME